MVITYALNFKMLAKANKENKQGDRVIEKEKDKKDKIEKHIKRRKKGKPYEIAKNVLSLNNTMRPKK